MEPEKAKQKDEAEERSAPEGKVVYEAIKQEGESELERLTSSLAWSGLAAGLSMGFSFIGKAVLRHHLPEAEWTPLLTNFGYSFGFLIVILGRQQLYTENTLTVILPFLVRKKLAILARIARLWAVVLIANLAGAFAFATVMARTTAVSPGVRETMRHLGEEAMGHDFATTLLRAIFAGWLIALMVWLLPFAQQFRVVVIILITYLVGVSQFPHIVGSSVDVFFLVAEGSTGLGTALSHFVLPVLLGNTIGGVTLVAILAHVQFAAHGEAVDS
ncbi:MAG TPA: formate/nitrite transporter family protein [Thermoanaerobaculia bacterium]|jgi:formate/nitrite transporter FocA (FNT family)